MSLNFKSACCLHIVVTTDEIVEHSKYSDMANFHNHKVAENTCGDYKKNIYENTSSECKVSKC